MDSAGETDTQCFGYDYLRRLTQAWTPTADCAAAPATASLGGPAPYWQSFGYDLTGNRTTETAHASGGDTTRTYAFPAAGGAHPHAVSRIDQTGPAGNRSDTFGYDAAGNTTGRNVAGKAQTLSWDAEGNLASVVDGTNTTAYLYDADGDRLIRRDPTGTTLYLDGTELHLDKTTGAVASTRYYTHKGQTVAVRTAAGVQFIASDPHGTGEVAITDKTGVVTRRRTAPFGGPRDTTAVTWPGEHGFVGGTIDSSTGLTHLGAREYDPAAGRFISADPIIDPADPQQLNGYAYANNNPTSMSDPDGQMRVADNNGGGPSVPAPSPSDNSQAHDDHRDPDNSSSNAVGAAVLDTIAHNRSHSGHLDKKKGTPEYKLYFSYQKTYNVAQMFAREMLLQGQSADIVRQFMTDPCRWLHCDGYGMSDPLENFTPAVWSKMLEMSLLAGALRGAGRGLGELAVVDGK